MAIRKNLVLGGSGMIGSSLCAYLKDQGESVTNLDIKSRCDLRFTDLSKYKSFDFVWFLAWDVGGAKYIFDKRYALKILRNNLALCENVFGFLENTKLPFLFFSTQLVGADSTYGATKVLGEAWARALGGKIVRLWNVYGWEDVCEKSHVVPDLITKALTNKEVRLITNGEEERQFVYVDDCIKNLIRIRDADNGSMFHLTNGIWIKIKDVADFIGRYLGVRVKLGDKKGFANKLDPDETYKHFTFEVPLKQGIEQLIRCEKAYLRMRK